MKLVPFFRLRRRTSISADTYTDFLGVIQVLLDRQEQNNETTDGLNISDFLALRAVGKGIQQRIGADGILLASLAQLLVGSSVYILNLCKR